MIIKENISKIRKHLSNGKLRFDNFVDNMNDKEKAVCNLTFAEYEIESALAGINKISRTYEENLPNFTTTDTAGGLIDFTGNGWLYIQLKTLLPSTRNNIGKKAIFDTITSLLDYHCGHYGSLPYFDKAFIGIIEHHKTGSKPIIFDHDNKSFQAVPNALKGRVFSDDNQFQMSLGLFSTMNSDIEYSEIYVLPMSDIGVFANYHLYNLS